MADRGLLSINDFAKFSRTTRDTLLYYDRIGLLSPILRGANNYRYYAGSQLAVINVIRTLQSLGMTLEEIKSWKDRRTPLSVEELFTLQIEKIDMKIEEWVSARKLLLALRDDIHSVSAVDEQAVSVKFFPAEAIVLGGLNDYSLDRNAYDALLSFYHQSEQKYPGLNLNYPVWGLFSEKRIKKGDWVCPDRYYFSNPEGYDRRPAALYAVGYTRGGYGQTDELYRRLISYINKNNLEICGDAYEEYPLNELCVSDEKNYLIRVMITVREKKS